MDRVGQAKVDVWDRKYASRNDNRCRLGGCPDELGAVPLKQPMVVASLSRESKNGSLAGSGGAAHQNSYTQSNALSFRVPSNPLCLSVTKHHW